MRSLKLNGATDAYSVWAKVWYRRPFAGGSIGDHAQLSPTPIGDHVQLFRDHAQLHPVPGVGLGFSKWLAPVRIHFSGLLDPEGFTMFEGDRIAVIGDGANLGVGRIEAIFLRAEVDVTGGGRGGGGGGGISEG